MDTHYSSERNVQMLVALMKFHGVKRAILSPGTTNITFVASLQCDPFFELYSAVDERSAAFMAVGLAAETGEPVALSCTGATASRDYLPGLTEAFYRKLPVLAVTSLQHPGRIGNACQQVIDRSRPPADAVVESVLANIPQTLEDEWALGVDLNRALIALRANGGGPAHVNLVTSYSTDFSVSELPPVKGIRRVERGDAMPALDGFRRIAVLVGEHRPWDDGLAAAVEGFCEAHDAVVLCNHASNYKGAHGVGHALSLSQGDWCSDLRDADLVIYIGGIPRYTSGMRGHYEMWRVNPDGLLRDPERALTRVFAMSEREFFEHYACGSTACGATRAGAAGATGYAGRWQAEYRRIVALAPELPLSSAWVAQHMAPRLPEGCSLHIAGANTARAWNFFEIPKSVDCFSNDGTMGIDGQVSALVGEALASPSRLHVGVVGDLTFFYDMNSIGNRHVGPNLRLCVVNNGIGSEFRIYSHKAYRFGDDAVPYMAAGGHFGDRSPDLVRHYAEDLGFEYLGAATKDEVLAALERFLDPERHERPMLLEVFTRDVDENDAVYAMNHIIVDRQFSAKRRAKDVVKGLLGEDGVKTVKRLLGKADA